jgi:hypothetical protein
MPASPDPPETGADPAATEPPTGIEVTVAANGPSDPTDPAFSRDRASAEASSQESAHEARGRGGPPAVRRAGGGR